MLHKAVGYKITSRNQELIDFLISKGVEVKAKNNQGEIALNIHNYGRAQDWG